MCLVHLNRLQVHVLGVQARGLLCTAPRHSPDASSGERWTESAQDHSAPMSHRVWSPRLRLAQRPPRIVRAQGDDDRGGKRGRQRARHRLRISVESRSLLVVLALLTSPPLCHQDSSARSDAANLSQSEANRSAAGAQSAEFSACRTPV